MEGQTLDALEFPVILERLAARTATPRGAALALDLLPAGDPALVRERQARTAEAIVLLAGGSPPELGGIVDVRDAAGRAARGSVLGPQALHEIEVAARLAAAARAVVESHRCDAPLLAELVSAIEPSLAPLTRPIAAAVEEDGSDLRDSASSHLRSLRDELRGGRRRVVDELEKLAGSSAVREHLQERFVTERAGRPVLAVRAGSRNSVPGIVHDASGSGQTLFVEPFAVVELNNRLSEAASAEREEVERILAELSALVAEHATDLVTLVETIAALDLSLASASLSTSWAGAPVEVGPRVRLLRARHPLLEPGSAVPIDLDLDELRAVVVSGPNTGGKTVALKTLGLAALLHQAGLRPPARLASLPVFDRVLADIGDHQSIEMSLSTFSGHLRTLVAVLGEATHRSLVLLDELAAGTDPVEGSALAQALVTRLAGQARLTVVTTHHPELKEWASATDGAANAATGFDPETYAPLFEVVVGRPGTSHALRVAERLGLERSIVEDARARIAPERRDAARMLAEAEAHVREAKRELESARQARDDAERAALRVAEREAALAAEIESVRASAADARAQAITAAESDLSAARAELRALRAAIRKAQSLERSRVRHPAAAEDTRRERDRSLGAAADREQAVAGELRRLEPVHLTGPLAVGDPVEAPAIGVAGTIARVEGTEAEVLGPGGLRVRVPLARLRPSLVRPTSGERQQPAVRVVASAPADAGGELDVRGRRGHEAREAVRQFIDDASLAGLSSVRIVHGRGTGAVRSAVRDELTRHPLVESHASDSADGATVVEIGGARGS